MYYIYTVARTPSFKCYFTAVVYKKSVVVLHLSEQAVRLLTLQVSVQ